LENSFDEGIETPGVSGGSTRPWLPFLVGNVVRLSFLSGMVALASASIHTAELDAPDWFSEPIYQTCGCVGVGLVVLWIGSELLMVGTRGIGLRVWLLVVALAAIYVPWF